MSVSLLLSYIKEDDLRLYEKSKHIGKIMRLDETDGFAIDYEYFLQLKLPLHQYTNLPDLRIGLLNVIANDSNINKDNKLIIVEKFINEMTQSVFPEYSAIIKLRHYKSKVVLPKIDLEWKSYDQTSLQKMIDISVKEKDCRYLADQGVLVGTEERGELYYPKRLFFEEDSFQMLEKFRQRSNLIICGSYPIINQIALERIIGYHDPACGYEYHTQANLITNNVYSVYDYTDVQELKKKILESIETDIYIDKIDFHDFNILSEIMMRKKMYLRGCVQASSLQIVEDEVKKTFNNHKISSIFHMIYVNIGTRGLVVESEKTLNI